MSSNSHDERRHCPDEKITAHPHSHQQINRFVEHSRLLPWLMLACILAGASIVLAIVAQRQASIATMRVEGMTRALIAHGIKDTYPHVPGEDD